MSGALKVVLNMIRAMNCLILGACMLMIAGVIIPKWGERYPAFPFGWAMSTFIVAAFSGFIVFSFHKASVRYRNEYIKKFILKNLESREIVQNQLDFLDKLQASYKCCGLNNYEDFTTDPSPFDIKNEGLNDELQQHSYKQNYSITWGDFLSGTSQEYGVLQDPKDCSSWKSKKFSWSGKVRLKKGNYPKSCCDAPGADGCTDKSRLYGNGCGKILEAAILRLHTVWMVTILFAYPWIVFVCSCVLTWAFRCHKMGISGRCCGIRISKPSEATRRIPMKHTNTATTMGSKKQAEASSSKNVRISTPG